MLILEPRTDTYRCDVCGFTVPLRALMEMPYIEYVLVGRAHAHGIPVVPTRSPIADRYFQEPGQVITYPDPSPDMPDASTYSQTRDLLDDIDRAIESLGG